MIYFILIGISLILFGGFLVLVSFERARGLRIAGVYRNKLDKKVARAVFVAQHVDWGAFTRHLLGTAIERLAHDIAHGTLRIVRTTERTLTRFVKHLRERRGMTVDETALDDESHPFRTGINKLRYALRSARKASRKPTKPVVPEEVEK